MRQVGYFILIFFFSINAFSQEHTYVKFFRKSLQQGKLLPPKNIENQEALMDEEPQFGEPSSKKLHNDIAYSLAIHPNQSLVASGSGKDKKVQVFNYQTKEIVHTFSGLKGGVRTLSFSPDGELLVAGTWSRQLYVWNVNTGNKIHQVSAHTKEIKALAFDPKGKYLATGSSDFQIMIWKVADMSKVKTLKGHKSKINDLVFTQDEKYLLSVADDKKIIVWNWQQETKHKELTEHKGKVTTVQIDEDQQFFLTGGSDNKVIKWDLKTFEKVKSSKTNYLNIHQLSIDKSASYFLRCGKEYQMQLFSYESLEEQQKILISKRGVLKCGFSYDNQYILGVNYNGELVSVPITLPSPYASVLLAKIQQHEALQAQYPHLQDTLLNLVENQVEQTLAYLENNSQFPLQNQLEEALYYTEYLQAQKQKPAYENYKNQLEVFLILVKKEVKSYQRVLSYFEQQKEQNPQELINYFVLSQIYEAQKEEGKHKVLLEEALTIKNDWKPALISLGNDEFKKGNTKKAAEYFNQLIKYHPSESIGYVKKAQVSFQAGEWMNTEIQLKKALQKDTNQSNTYYWLGNLAFERGQYKDAEKHYQNAIEKNELFFDAHWKQLLMKFHMYEHHLRDKNILYNSRLVLRKFPNDYLLAKRYVLLYKYQSDQKLRNEFSRSFKDRNVLLDSAYQYAQKVEEQEGEVLRNEILSLQGKPINKIFSSQVLAYRFKLQQQTFTKEDEKALLQYLKKENPSDQDFYLLLLQYYHQTNTKKFEKWYQKTNDKFPNSPWVQYEYLKLIGISDVKKVNSIINTGLKKDKNYSFFYQIRNNLKQEGSKRMGNQLLKEPQLAYDSVQLYQDYVIYYYDDQAMFKSPLGKVFLATSDYQIKSFDQEETESIRWSYYVDLLESPYHKYGLGLKVQTEKMKKFGVNQLKPPVPPLFDTLYCIKNGGVIVEQNQLKGLYHLDYGELLPTIYQKIYFANKHCLFVQTQEKKWGAVDWNGEILIPFEYDQIMQRKIKGVEVLEVSKVGKKSHYNYSGQSIEPYNKKFSFTQTVKGKVQSLIGYDIYADFADSYELHKELRSYDFFFGNADSLLSIAVLGYVNQARLKEKLPPFFFSSSMHYAALNHVNDMIYHKFYNSKSKLWYKTTLANRIQIEGGVGYGYTELLHKEPEVIGINYKDFVQKVLKKQLKNKNFREKLLSTKYRYFTCGVKYNHDAKNYYLVYDLAEELEDKEATPIKFKWTDAMFSDYTYETFALLPEIHKKADPKNMNYDLLNAALFYETNRQRVLNGGSRYLHSPKLEEAAFMHSKDMTEHNFFSHTSILPGKKSVGDRYKIVGARYSGSWGENIHMHTTSNSTYFELAVASLNSWMHSPGHKANILNEGFKFIGCAGYLDPNSKDFNSTQNFTGRDLSYKPKEKVKKVKDKKTLKKRKKSKKK